MRRGLRRSQVRFPSRFADFLLTFCSLSAHFLLTFCSLCCSLTLTFGSLTLTFCSVLLTVLLNVCLSMPAGSLPSPGGGGAAPPKQRMGRRQSVIERLQGPPAPGMPAEVSVGSGLSGVDAVVASLRDEHASLPQSVCQLCGPGSMCGPGCVGRSAPAGAIPSAGGGGGGGARRGGGGRRASVIDRLSLRPDGGPGQPDRLQSFSSNRTNKTVSLAIGGGDGSGLPSPGTDTDDFDTPGSTRSPVMRMGRRASVVVQDDGAKVIVPLAGGNSAQNKHVKLFSFGKEHAQMKSRDMTLGSLTEEPRGSPKDMASAGPTATARPEIGAATTREGVETAFGAALKARMQEYLLREDALDRTNRLHLPLVVWVSLISEASVPPE